MTCNPLKYKMDNSILIHINMYVIIHQNEKGFISYHSYYLYCCMLPDKCYLSDGMRLYQVMMTLHFFNDVANDA